MHHQMAALPVFPFLYFLSSSFPVTVAGNAGNTCGGGNRGIRSCTDSTYSTNRDSTYSNYSTERNYTT